MGRDTRAAWRRTANCILTVGLFFSSGEAWADWRCAPAEASCKTIFIVDNSWHAAIVLDRDDLSLVTLPELSDFPNAQFIEFSWGDQDYFPDPNSGIWAALRAAFWSGGSVLHLVGFSENVSQFYADADIFELHLAVTAQQQLIRYLSQSVARRNSTGRAPASPGLYANSRFYPATGKFGISRTCNTWVAEALESAGLPLSPGSVLTAGNLASQLADIGEAH